MEVAPGIHCIPVASISPMGMYAPNVYVVAGKEGALVDSGYYESALIDMVLQYLKGLAPLTVTRILVTHSHPDHVGGCQRFKEATGASIVLHSAGIARADRYHVTGDILVDDGDVLEVGGLAVEVIHTPGHTPDSVCFYIRGSETLFTGDHILGFGTPVMGTDGNIAQYIESLEKLLSYRIRLICPGHGPVVRQPERKIRELIAHRHEREEQIIEWLGRGKRTVRELISQIYPELDPRLDELAKTQVLAHLSKLTREGVVTVSGEEYAVKQR